MVESVEEWVGEGRKGEGWGEAGAEVEAVGPLSYLQSDAIFAQVYFLIFISIHKPKTPPN